MQFLQGFSKKQKRFSLAGNCIVISDNIKIIGDIHNYKQSHFRTHCSFFVLDLPSFSIGLISLAHCRQTTF